MRDIRRTMQLQLQKIRYKITIQAQQYDKQACAVGEKGQRKKNKQDSNVDKEPYNIQKRQLVYTIY